MKKIYLMLALLLGVSAANAQITTGETTSKVVRTGNRAKAGNAGIYIGATTDMFKNLFDKGPGGSYRCLPLINLKYMYTDDVEFRLGFEWWREQNTTENDTEEQSYEASTFERQFTLSPGVAYHFSNHNLLDVYVGGEVPFGWGAIGSENDFDDTDQTSKNFHVGLGAFIGLQAYIANLPLALGVEYGVSTSFSKATEGYLTQDGLWVDAEKGYAGEDFSEKRL